MPAPNCTRELPEGYREILSIDLQKDRKTALLVNGLTLIPTVILAIIGLAVTPIRSLFDMSRGFGPYFLRFGIMFGGLFLYIVLHELTHAAVMKAYGAKRLRFGFTGLYAFAGSEEDFFAKRPYRQIALAPLAVWTLVFGVLAFLVARDWFWVVWFWQIMNVSGAAGDVYVTMTLLHAPRDILVKDTGVSMTVYSAEQKNRL